jgi:hypothetical protein
MWDLGMQLGSLVVGLPTVSLKFPQTLVAWLRLRHFVHTSFEFPEMIRVEAGFTAIVLLVIALQVMLFQGFKEHALLVPKQ